MANRKLFPPQAALRAFEAVGRLGRIRRAAKELEIDHATVSRHIRTLEEWLGVALLERHEAGFALTEHGQSYHQEISAALAVIATATGRMMAKPDERLLTIWCIPGFASLWLADRLEDFSRNHPRLSVDLRPSDDQPDFRAREVDCDIRYVRDWEQRPPMRGVKSYEFARPVVFPVCSASLLPSLPPIVDAASLLSCPLLHEDNDAEWTGWFRAQDVRVESRLPGARLWHAHLTLNAARQGRGIALVNPLLLSEGLTKGLVVIIPRPGEFKPVHFGGYTLSARADEWNTPAVTAFREWVTRTAEGANQQAPNL